MSSQQPDEAETSALVFNICSMVGILVLTIISGLAPLKLESFDTRTREKVLSHFAFVTGGVFLGAGLLHMLPDVVKQQQKFDFDFPWAFLTACAGFMVVYSVDKIQLGDNSSSMQVEKRKILAVAANAQNSEADICWVSVPPVTTYSDAPELKGIAPATKDVLASYAAFEVEEGPRQRTSSGSGSGSSSRQQQQNNTLQTSTQGSISRTNRACSHEDIDHSHGHGHGGDSFTHGGSHSPDAHRHPNVHHHHLRLDGTSIMLPLLLTLMFSVHSFIAGLALGVQSNLSSSAVSILVAILAHKVVEALAVGSNFIREKVAFRKAVPIILVYCLMTPFGILMGMLLQSALEGDTSILVESEAQAFAAGSFLYLAVHEIADDDCCAVVKPRNQVLLLAVGMTFMAIIAIWV